MFGDKFFLCNTFRGCFRDAQSIFLKQPPEVLCKKDILKNRKCFPGNFPKFLITPF